MSTDYHSINSPDGSESSLKTGEFVDEDVSESRQRNTGYVRTRLAMIGEAEKHRESPCLVVSALLTSCTNRPWHFSSQSHLSKPNNGGVKCVDLYNVSY